MPFVAQCLKMKVKQAQNDKNLTSPSKCFDLFNIASMKINELIHAHL